MIDPVRVALGNDPAAPGDSERRGERLRRIERGLDCPGKLYCIDLRGHRRHGQQIAHRPGLGRGIRQRGVKPPRREEHIVARARQDHTALVGELPGGARHPVRQREAHAACLPVHFRRERRASRLRWLHEGTVLLDRRREAAPGDEQHRTQQFGETRSLQFDRIAWRDLPQRRVFLRRSRLRVARVRNAARDQPREKNSRWLAALPARPPVVDLSPAASVASPRFAPPCQVRIVAGPAHHGGAGSNEQSSRPRQKSIKSASPPVRTTWRLKIRVSVVRFRSGPILRYLQKYYTTVKSLGQIG